MSLYLYKSGEVLRTPKKAMKHHVSWRVVLWVKSGPQEEILEVPGFCGPAAPQRSAASWPRGRASLA